MEDKRPLWDRNSFYLVKLETAKVPKTHYVIYNLDEINGFCQYTYPYDSLEKLAEVFASTFKWDTNGINSISTIPAPMVRASNLIGKDIQSVHEPANVEEIKKFLRLYMEHILTKKD